MKLGDFLNTLARKGNIEIDFATLANVKLDELNKIEIDDSVTGQFDSALMSLDGAKNNPLVLNHFKPIILKAADDKFALLAEKYGFSDDVLNEKSTYKKFDILETKLEEKIKAIEEKQGTTGNKEKEAQLTKQLQDLQAQLTSVSAQKDSDLKALRDSHESELTQMSVNSVLSGFKFATKDLPADVNTQIARTLIDSQLKTNGAQLIRKDGQLKLVQSANPELDYLDASHKPLSFSDLATKVLADNKLLEVSSTQTQQTQQHTHTTVQTQGNLNTSKFDAALAEAMN
jgi:hypothetical protein